MSDIRDAARQEAERRWDGAWTHAAMRDAFEAGAVWAREQAGRESSALRSHVRDLTGETDEGLTEVGGFRGERHDSTETGSVATPSDADLVSVSWFDCDCGFSKPCAESHLKRARVPRALLAAHEVRHAD